MEEERYDALWKKAKAALSTSQKNRQEALSNDIGGVMQALNTYRIELDMQNDELQKTQLALEESRRKYIDLYDFAPVAYLTISEDNKILEANLTGLKLFGTDSPLKGLEFSSLIAPSSQDIFHLHKRRVLDTLKKQVCELELLKADGTKFNALLQSIAILGTDGDSDSIRLVIIDLTERK